MLCSLRARSKAYLAVNEKLEEGDWLLRAVLVHARHVEVIQEDHEALAHGRPIGVLGSLLCAILLCIRESVKRHSLRIM